MIERGALKAGTSGGTSLECVIAHVEKTRPASAVIVTDGFVEAIAKKRVAALARTTRLHAIVTRDGNPSLLKAAGIPYSQLGGCRNDQGQRSGGAGPPVHKLCSTPRRQKSR